MNNTFTVQQPGIQDQLQSEQVGASAVPEVALPMPDPPAQTLQPILPTVLGVEMPTATATSLPGLTITTPEAQKVELGEEVWAFNQGKKPGLFTLRYPEDAPFGRVERIRIDARHENFERPEFYLGKFQNDQHVTRSFSLQDDIRVGEIPEEARVKRGAHFDDKGFSGSAQKALNKFYPPPPPIVSIEHDRLQPYDASRGFNTKIRFGGPSPGRGLRNRRRVEKQCPRCGSQLAWDRCEHCGVAYCTACSEVLGDQGKCRNWACAAFEDERAAGENVDSE